MVPGRASSASLLLRNAADSAWKSIIYVTFAQKCSRWCLEEHYLRHFRSETQQMVPGIASSASLLPRNAADSTWKSIICVTFAQKRSRWCQGMYHLRHYCSETQQIVPGGVSSASILLRNAAYSAWRSIICVTFAQKRSR